MSGFSDTSLWYNYDQTTYVTTGPVANAFKVPQPLGGATPWPTSEIVVETWDGTTFRTLPNSEWQIQGGYLYVYPSTISVWPPTSYRFVVWRRVPSQQTYTGADALALQPAALSAAMDIVGRMAQEALEAANRSLQIHVLDTLNDAFTGKNLHPSKLTLPPIATRAGKVIGFDSLGNIGYFTNSSAGGTSTPDAGALVQRDGAGRSQFVNPATGADAATKDYVDNYASVGLWNNAKTYALNEVVQRNGILVKSQQAANTGNDPATDTTGTWWTPAGGGSAIVDFYTAGAAITAGQWVREGASGIVPAAAGPSAAASAVIGIALTSGAGGATIKVHKFGIAKGVTTGRTAGDILYLSTSSGAHTVDQSSLGYGVNQVRVGIAVSATDIFVCPDNVGQATGYVYNPSGRYGLSGWNVYLDSAGVATPVDGIGGAPVITLASNSSSPLDVASDLLLTKSGATTRQGQGISTDFTIDRGDTGTPAQVTFRYKTSANYAVGDIAVFLYDITNAALIPISYSALDPTAGGIGAFVATFLPTSSLNYRLILHIASASALDYTVNLAKVQVGPQAIQTGPILSSDNPWSPTIGGTTTAPGLGTNTQKGAWRRSGAKIELYWEMNMTVAGTTGSGTYVWPLPNGLTVDTTNIVLDDGTGYVGTVLGVGEIMGASPVALLVRALSATQLILSSHSGGVIGSGYYPFNQTIRMSFQATVPVAQWSVSTTYAGINEPFCLSNTEAVANTNGVVGKTYQGWDGAPILANTAVTTYDMTLPRALLPNEVPMLEFYDAVGKFWVNVASAGDNGISAGNYVGYAFTSSESSSGQVVGIGIVPSPSSGTLRVAFNANPNVIIGVSAQSWATLSAKYSRWRVRIGKSAGVAEIAPTVYAFYKGLVLQTSPLRWDTKVEDAFNAVTTGASWKFTCPLSGLYMVDASFYPGSNAWGATLNARRNGVNYITTTPHGLSSGTSEYTWSFKIRLSAGDVFDITNNLAMGGTPTGNIQITRVGS